VAYMFVLGWGDGGEGWKWRRRLFSWKEKQVVEL